MQLFGHCFHLFFSQHLDERHESIGSTLPQLVRNCCNTCVVCITVSARICLSQLTRCVNDVSWTCRQQSRDHRSFGIEKKMSCELQICSELDFHHKVLHDCTHKADLSALLCRAAPKLFTSRCSCFSNRHISSVSNSSGHLPASTTTSCRSFVGR